MAAEQLVAELTSKVDRENHSATGDEGLSISWMAFILASIILLLILVIRPRNDKKEFQWHSKDGLSYHTIIHENTENSRRVLASLIVVERKPASAEIFDEKRFVFIFDNGKRIELEAKYGDQYYIDANGAVRDLIPRVDRVADIEHRIKALAIGQP